MKRMVTAMSTKMPKASQGSSTYSNTGIGSGIQAAMKKKKMDDAKKKASKNAGEQLKSMSKSFGITTSPRKQEVYKPIKMNARKTGVKTMTRKGY